MSLEGKLTLGRVPAIRGGVIRSLPLPCAYRDLFNCFLGGGVLVCFVHVLLLHIPPILAPESCGQLWEGSRGETAQFGCSMYLGAECLQISISLEHLYDLCSCVSIFSLRTMGQSTVPDGACEKQGSFHTSP